MTSDSLPRRARARAAGSSRPAPEKKPHRRLGLRLFLRENGLSIVFAALFLVCLAAQAVSGYLAWNEELLEHGRATLSFGAYLTSGHFLEAMFENWESEFLQMGLFVLLTVHLYQQGSSESKKISEDNPSDEDPRQHRDHADAPGPVRRGGVMLKLYEHSLSIALLTLFMVSFVAHAFGGVRRENEMRALEGQPPESTLDYLASSQFWYESFQNWQSEFLAVFAIVVLSIFLRERGSPQSKPVAAPHSDTGD